MKHHFYWSPRWGFFLHSTFCLGEKSPLSWIQSHISCLPHHLSSLCPQFPPLHHHLPNIRAETPVLFWPRAWSMFYLWPPLSHATVVTAVAAPAPTPAMQGLEPASALCAMPQLEPELEPQLRVSDTTRQGSGGRADSTGNRAPGGADWGGAFASHNMIWF